MSTVKFDCRTVAIVRELQTNKRQGANGEFEEKSILFRIAVDRRYKVSRQENGKTVSQYATDFWLAKATGPQADFIANYCSAKREDGKLISRHLLVDGDFENYQKERQVTRHVTIPINVNGVTYTYENDITFTIDKKENTETIFVVKEIKPLDSNPEAGKAGTKPANSVTIGGAGNLTPAPAPAGQTASAPVQGQQPVQTAPATAAAQPAPAPQQGGVITGQPMNIGGTAQAAVGTIDGTMNPPTVGEGFAPTGENCPF